MSKLNKKLNEMLAPYAEEQGAEYAIYYDETAKTLHAELVSDSKVASVDYGPEDFENDNPTAKDIFEFLRTAWEDADK